MIMKVNLSYKYTTLKSMQKITTVRYICLLLGHDSRFNLESNLGCTVIGDQETSWLFQQTKTLHELGARVTYTGDQPFLLRLILGITNDSGNDSASKMPLYLSDECNQKMTPLSVHPETHQRTDVEVTFRSDLPKTSLVFFEHIAQVSVDATHARARIVENDLAKWVNKIYKEKSEEWKHSAAIQNFENNLTQREVKRPFKFNIQNHKCGQISLAGSEAGLAIAERDELGDSVLSDLFHGVWLKSERIRYDERCHCHQVLKQLQPRLINPDSYISLADAAELWRKSLNAIFQLIRNEKNFNLSAYKFWTEVYYQICLTVFGSEHAFTPYKLKLILIRNIVEAGYIKHPWNHLTEALEKSNHHAQKDFYSRTMMGGGGINSHDPKFVELYISFTRILSRQLSVENDEDGTVLSFLENYYQFQFNENPKAQSSYSDIVCKPIPEINMDIGAVREKRSLLLGMRFTILGNFSTARQSQIAASIKSLGGHVHTFEFAANLMKKHSELPFCYVLLRDDKVLRQATDKTSSLEPTKNLALAKNLQILAGGNWKFLHESFVTDTEKLMTVLDPKKYELIPGERVLRHKVRDIRPLLKRQRLQCDKTEISTATHVKRFRSHFKDLKVVSSSESGTDED